MRRGASELGVVPLENSIEGAVTATFDELAFGPPGVAIRAELNVPIDLHLVAAAGTALADVEVVRSHPQPLGAGAAVADRPPARCADRACGLDR